jgi:hypothetical protein
MVATIARPGTNAQHLRFVGQKKPPLGGGGGWALEYLSFFIICLSCCFRFSGCGVVLCVACGGCVVTRNSCIKHASLHEYRPVFDII